MEDEHGVYLFNEAIGGEQDVAGKGGEPKRQHCVHAKSCKNGD